MSKPFTPEEQRKYDKIKEMTLTVVRKMDNQKGLNVKRYEDMFKVFDKDPDAFRNWDVLHNYEFDSTVQLFQLPFEEVRMNQIKDAAHYLGIELEGYIYYRHHDPKGVRSKMKVPVGLI